LQQQRADGGFSNRRSNSDLYYTAFALRSLSALGELSPASAEAALEFLNVLRRQDAALRIRQPRGAFSDAVASTSWWDSLQLCEEVLGPRLSDADRDEARAATMARLQALQRDDGGIAKTSLDGCGSLYHTLLASALKLRWGERLEGVERAARFVRSLQVEGGGFFENRFSRRPATNGSAAGVVLAIMLGSADPALALSEAALQRHVSFLVGQQSDEGGWLAAPGAPMADLLSTFAALFVLQQCGWRDAKALSRAKAFAQSLELESGGYIGFALEQHADCEYTFYGLGVTAV